MALKREFIILEISAIGWYCIAAQRPFGIVIMLNLAHSCSNRSKY